MAFKLDDIIVDRIQYGVAENSKGELLYVLTQLSDAKINVTADSKDAVDATGSVVKKFYRGKKGELTATNAFLNLSIAGAASGSGKKSASETDKIRMPRIITVKAGKTFDLGADARKDTVKVYALGKNGAMDDKIYGSDTTAAADKFSISGAQNTLTPPTTAGVTQYIVKYDRDVANGVQVTNKANRFPQTVKLTLKALAVDPCEPDTLRSIYIEIPSFQVSPELEIGFTTEGNLNYAGTLQQNYCSDDKELYSIYAADGDDEEDDTKQ